MKNKRILITSTDLMMVQFLLPHVINLSESGYDVDLACSDVGGRLEEIKEKLQGYIGNIYTVNLRRSPLSISNFKGYRELCRIIDRGNYGLIWTNEPVMGVVTRLSARNARQNGTKVLYMVHGFHFYNGAPFLNWMIYYPIERLMAPYSDIICTVNTEDYRRAKTFNVDRVEYIHGIGINTARLSNISLRHNIRDDLGLNKDTFIVLSIGELNKNKNQKTIIEAIALLKNKDIHYIICGKGYMESNLMEYANKFGIADSVHFMGYRKDVVDICSQSDVYAMPSFREGLPVSSLEAMYCGLPLVTSNIRGLTDVNKDGVNGFLCAPDNASAFADKIRQLYENPDICKKIGARNKEDVIPYTIANTKTEILCVLKSL